MFEATVTQEKFWELNRAVENPTNENMQHMMK